MSGTTMSTFGDEPDFESGCIVLVQCIMSVQMAAQINAPGQGNHSKGQPASVGAAHRLVAILALYFPVVSGLLLSSA